MQNVSECIKQIFLKLSGFFARLIWGLLAKNYKNRRCQFWERGWGKILTCLQLSQFWLQEAENFSAPRHTAYRGLCSEFRNPIAHNGAWGDDRRNQTFVIFW